MPTAVPTICPAAQATEPHPNLNPKPKPNQVQSRATVKSLVISAAHGQRRSWTDLRFCFSNSRRGLPPSSLLYPLLLPVCTWPIAGEIYY